jgi:acyl dehydratase
MSEATSGNTVPAFRFAHAGYKLCSFGVAGRAVLKLACKNDPARPAHMQVRFTAPAFPGETIRREIWRDRGTVSFRARALVRDVVILNNGLAKVSDQ